MKIQRFSIVLGLALASVLSARCAQAQPRTTEDLQKQIDALKTDMKAVQKELAEINALLAPLKAQQPVQPQTVVLDLTNRPFKGARTAPLTLVEFTDYQ
jgi:protein-disulfide isomerase